MKKIIILLFATLLVLTTACSSHGNSTLTSQKETNIALINGCYIYDVDVPEQAAYYHDYIFAARVLEVGENFDPYMEPEYIAKHGERDSMFENPSFTKYQLQVTQVIKGNIQVGDVLNTRKRGYYDEVTQMYILEAGDVFPEQGKEYLFLSNVDSDTGMHVVAGPYTTIPLESSEQAISTYALTDEIQNRQVLIDKYTKAYNNEVPFVDPAEENTNATEGSEVIDYTEYSNNDEPISSIYE